MLLVTLLTIAIPVWSMHTLMVPMLGPTRMLRGERHPAARASAGVGDRGTANTMGAAVARGGNRAGGRLMPAQGGQGVTKAAATTTTMTTMTTMTMTMTMMMTPRQRILQ